MKAGFIGAGKVGFSIGKHLTAHGTEVSGYYSRTPESSRQAAEFTGSRQYMSLKQIAEDSDILFLSVCDSAIAPVWEQLKKLPLQNKLICHFSGVLSSGIFSDIERVHAYGYSVHPLFAFSDRYESYRHLADAFFTIEGNPEQIHSIEKIFHSCGNHTAVISPEAKVRYHAAAAVASNLYVGLAFLAEEMLQDCGFSPEAAHEALGPLIRGNAENIVSSGPVQALTGPVERNDTDTAAAHLSCLTGQEREIYRLLSLKVLQAAQQRHPDRDYREMKGVLQ